MATREQISLQKIDGLISTVKAHLTNFNDTVQDAAVAIIEHASVHGDCSRAKILARAVPSRLRNMLVGYFRLYSPIGVTIGKTAADDKGRFVSDDAITSFRERFRLANNDGKLIDVSKWPKFAIDQAKANKWYDDPARVAPEPKPLDGTKEAWDRIETFFDRILADVRKDDEKAKYREEERPILVEMVNDLRAMVTRYHIKMLAKQAENDTTDEEAADESVTNIAPPAARNRGGRPRKVASVH